MLTSAQDIAADWQGWGMGPGMMGGYGYGYGMGWVWSIVIIVFWILVIVGIIFLVRWIAISTRSGGQTGGGESALDVLKKRYARGEIDKDEFEERKRDLL